MDSNKVFHVELTLKQKKKFSPKKKKVTFDIKSNDIKNHLTEFLTPYEHDLLRKELLNNSVDFGHLVTEIGKHDSKVGKIINGFDYNAIRTAKIEPAVEKDFIDYLKLLLKVDAPKENTSDLDE